MWQIAVTAFLTMLALTFGCTQVEERRLQHARAYITAHPELSRQAKEDILAGRMWKGMPREQVIAALGGLACTKPDHRGAGPGGKEFEYCHVPGETRHTGTVLMFQDGVLANWEEYEHTP
jgi:hypothetical protein